MGPVACKPGEIAIPFAVGDNRSRTWVITRTDAGVRLKHVHRHDDGHEDKVSRYGGDTVNEGSHNSPGVSGRRLLEGTLQGQQAGTFGDERLGGRSRPGSPLCL
jgi:hypothetical protein